METKHITNMTVEELKALIIDIVNERLSSKEQAPQDNRSVKEILESIERHRWTPPPGSKSTLELLREDRDA
ncbi:hypothetical protein G7B40_002510 [Aetokthonos hydrillicola Thurmond2011]|jgi:hypothetical protein|uniref:Uncharacterized protein n=1 Tax=Aetokthonos hydrillicola Thurmond2011 TaxID=2712845 RepID=A0AAP5I2G1_9CYAN|nr:hypothetical protein [Aetokthonos hydrillicola]MBW4588147.1 hypothetical protein [Aetokthonos hydrillicola CCALA 1050]MDR9893461.1 hypothetical protein [Aetokthonos hydrillicola Thurmond2011]